MKSLNEIRDALQKKKGELTKRLERVDANLSHHNNPLDKDFAEQAVQRENEEVVQALQIAIREEMKHINVALHRIDKGEYQVCSSCGDDIPIARLEAVPYTSMCMKCAEHSQNQ